MDAEMERAEKDGTDAADWWMARAVFDFTEADEGFHSAQDL
eukprot:COSAG01_NODE_26160_length_722_cov_1.025682_1_plen_40_part_10